MHLVVGEWAPGALLPLGVTPSSRGIMLCHALAVSFSRRLSSTGARAASSVWPFRCVRLECLFCLHGMTPGVWGWEQDWRFVAKSRFIAELSKALCLSPQCLHLCIPGALLRPSSNWHWWGFSSLFYQVSHLSCSIYGRHPLLYYSSPVRVFLNLVKLIPSSFFMKVSRAVFRRPHWLSPGKSVKDEEVWVPH